MHLAHQLLDFRGQQRQYSGRDEQANGDSAVEFHERAGVVGVEEASQITRELVAERGGEKPHAHHNPKQFRGRKFRHRTQAYRTQEHLADHLKEEETDQPQRADLAVSCEHRGGNHQQIPQADEEQTESEFDGAGGLTLAQTNPEHGEKRREDENESRRQRLHPACREYTPTNLPVDQRLGKEVKTRPFLFIRCPEENSEEKEDENSSDALPLILRQWLVGHEIRRVFALPR